jgi:hypothetical protein|tara:strand:- start:275 stop:799 length:525 start_codon:yes stop_codon:yes gene_type:complete
MKLILKSLMLLRNTINIYFGVFTPKEKIMATLYVMKCNKKNPYKIGKSNKSPTEIDSRRQSVERSIRKEFGKDYLVKIVWVKEIEDPLMCSLIEWQIQHYLQLKGYQRKWNGFTVKSNGSSEWFYLPKGLKTFKSYLALGHKYWESNPAPMPEEWEILKNGNIFKKPKKARSAN